MAQLPVLFNSAIDLFTEKKKSLLCASAGFKCIGKLSGN
jgi:hypothetical protein